MKKRIVVVDDEEDVRAGLVALLDELDPWRVVGQAASAHEAVQVIEQTSPDMVVVDVILGEGLDGIQLTRAIKADRPLLPVVILSARDEALFAQEALLAGASAYVMKGSLDALLGAVEAAADGGVWVSPETFARLLPPGLVPSTALQAIDPDSDEGRVLREIRAGNRTVDGLARALGQHFSTVERALDRLQEMSGLPSRASLYLYVHAV